MLGIIVSLSLCKVVEKGDYERLVQEIEEKGKDFRTKCNGRELIEIAYGMGIALLHINPDLTPNLFKGDRADYVKIVDYLTGKYIEGGKYGVKFSDGKTLLHFAAFTGNYGHVKTLVRKGINVNSADQSGSTPLHVAALRGHARVVKYLLRRGANVDVKDAMGNTPLMWAIVGRHSDVARHLVLKGADVNAENEAGKTPLHVAAASGNLSIVRLLVSKGAKVNHEAKDGTTPLHIAAVMGNTDVIRYLVKKGARLDVEDVNGLTPLHYAALSVAEVFKGKENTETVRYLVGEYMRKGTYKKRFTGGLTLLHFAAYGGDLSQVRRLLRKKGIGVNVRTQEGLTPLHVAAMKGHTDIVRYLVRKGADINATDTSGYTPLHYAVLSGHTEVVRYLVSENVRRGNWNVRFKDGTTLLHFAAFGGDLKQVKYLVKKGADILAEDRSGHTPLHWAAGEAYRPQNNFETILNLFEKGRHPPVVRYLVGILIKRGKWNVKFKDGKNLLHFAAFGGNLKQVKYLIGKGVDVNARDITGRTPADMANLQNHVEVVKYLEEKGGSSTFARIDLVNTPEGEGGITVVLGNEDEDTLENPLHRAAEKGDLREVKRLIKEGANVNARNGDGSTPLHKAAQKGHLKVVKYLIRKGADVNAKDRYGYTPLHLSVSEDHEDVVAYLVKMGADVNARDGQGFTPLHVAAMEGKWEMVRYLLDSGADVNVRNNDGETPLFWVARHGNVEMVKYMIKKGAKLNVRNVEGKTPCDVAKKWKRKAVIPLLCPF